MIAVLRLVHERICPLQEFLQLHLRDLTLEHRVLDPVQALATEFQHLPHPFLPKVVNENHIHIVLVIGLEWFILLDAQQVLGQLVALQVDEVAEAHLPA